MTIASQTSRIAYTGDGVTTSFAVPFYFQANADLVVYLQDTFGNQTIQLLGTNYSLTGATLSTGGTCTFVTAPTTGYLISIYRDPQLTQTTSYNNNDPFPAKSHELALDKLTTIDQRTRDMVSRAVHITDAESPSTVTALATVATRKNKLFGFGTSGELIYPLGPSFVSPTYVGVADVDSRATAQVTTFPISITVVRTRGYGSPGDGGGADYVRGIVSSLGAFQDAGGVYWGLASNANRYVDVRALGAGHGSQAQDDTALAAAITWANALGGSCAIFIPPAAYTFGPCATRITASRVAILGDISGTKIATNLSAGQSWLLIGNKALAVTKDTHIGGFNINATGNSATSILFTLENLLHIEIKDLDLTLFQTIFVAGTTTDIATWCGDVYISNWFGTSANAGAPAIFLNRGANLTMVNCGLYIEIANPAHLASQATTAGTHFITSTGGHWDAAHITNVFTQFFDVAFAMTSGASGVLIDFYMSNCIFANCKSYAFLFDVSAGGAVGGWNVTGCWIESWENDAIKCSSGGGFCDDHKFIGNRVNNAGACHLHVTGLSTNNMFMDNRLACGNQTNGGANSIFLAAGAQGWSIHNNVGNTDDSASIGTWRCPIGIFVGVDCDNYSITGNRVLGSTNSIAIAANTGASRGRRCFNNSFASVTTYGGYAGIAVGALSSSQYINTTPFVLDVMISGGTVTGISIGGTAIGSAIAGTFRLEPGETLSVTQSVLPNVTIRTCA